MGISNVQVFDGVAVTQRGDLIVFVYGADARLHRTRWSFDRADEFAARCKEGILCLFLIPPGSSPPDGATRHENASRFKRLLPSIRRFVTVPLGDAIQVSIVKAVMRAMILVQRQVDRHSIANSEDEGITRILERATKDTPDRATIEACIQSLRDALAAAPKTSAGAPATP